MGQKRGRRTTIQLRPQNRDSRYSWSTVAVVVTCCLALAQVAAGQGQPEAVNGESPFPTFVKHTIDSEFRNGYQVAVADIDGDGLPDILALSTNPSRLVWFKNPAWESFEITKTTRGNIDLAPYDVDGDGDLDLALASEFSLFDSTSGGEIYWLECPENPEDGQPWAMHYIDTVPTSHRVRWADMTGDGKKELLNLPIIGVGANAPEYATGVRFKAYTIPQDPRTGRWKQVTLDDSLETAHGISVVQWDDDAQEEILTASFGGVHLFDMASDGKTVTRQRLGSGNRGARPKQGSSEVGMGTLGTARERFLATIEPWHGHEVVVYRPNADGTVPWKRRVIETNFNDGHALACADLDGNGSDEIVAGHRGPDYTLYVFRYDAGGDRWERFTIDAGGLGAAGLVVADINLDGRLDIVATGTATNNVVWYENRGPKSKS